jgi:hypothetical protein
MASRDDSSIGRAILAAAFMLAVTVLGVTWALMVNGPGLLGLTFVVVAIIGFAARAGQTTLQGERNDSGQGTQVERKPRGFRYALISEICLSPIQRVRKPASQ